MKKKLLIIFANLISIAFFSQLNNGFSYQSILRDNNGTPVANQDLSIEIEISQGTNGINIYEESHNVTTNFVGIINLIIGSGSSIDEISDILWDNPPYFMEVYVNDGSGLQLISSSEILNVPIAMYAKYGEDEDSDTTNEYNISAVLNGNNLEIVDAGGTLTVDLSNLQSLSGTDDQNILGSGLSGDTLTIGIEGGSSQTIDLSTIKGTDDQNIFNSGLIGGALTIGIEGGNSQTVDLSSLIGSDDQTASQVVSSQTTNISATNVDDAIAELANEKLDVQGGIMLGDINMNSNNINFIGTAIADTFSGELKGTINTTTTAITQPAGDNSLKIATTAFVKNAVLKSPTVQQLASTGSFIIDADKQTDGVLTAMASPTVIEAPTGNPVQGQKLTFRFKDNGSSRNLTWNVIFRAIGVSLPSMTNPGKLMYVNCKYNSEDTRWDVLSIQIES